jgi:3-oxoacyl-[acyl-carrier-protein] synthase-3
LFEKEKEVMNRFENLHIVSIASLVGKKEITNTDLAPRIGISAEDILAKTGIRSRFHCGEGENLFTLLASSLLLACARKGMDANQVNGIFVGANPTGPFLMPNTASIVASLAGIEQFHFGGQFTGCAGGLSALQAACNQLTLDSMAGKRKTYAVVAGDHTSVMMTEDSTDQMLFTDGASCMLVSNDPDIWLLDGVYTPVWSMNSVTLTEHADALVCPPAGHMIHDGRRVYRFATRLMPKIHHLLERLRFPPHSLFIPHQANLRIIRELTRGLKCHIHDETVQAIGNSSPASVSMALDYEWTRGTKHSQDQPVFLAAFGEGLTITVAELEGPRRRPRLVPSDDIEQTRAEVIKRYAASCWTAKTIR